MAILRRIKDKVKDKVKKALTKARPAKTKEVQKETKKEIFHEQQVAVEQVKFYTHEPRQAHPVRQMPQELPFEYGRDKIVLQVRDCSWLHAYWEVGKNTFDRLISEYKDDFYRSKRVLRAYDVSHIVFNGSNAHSYFDIQVNEFANNWYIDTGSGGRSWCVDLGLILPDGRFVTIVRSNTVYTPLEGPSWITDEEWMVPEDMFARLYGLGFGFGQTSPLGKAWQERIRRSLFSGALASGGMASMASPVKEMQKERKFRLVVDCELIVYGATEPDAKVTVQNKEITLRPDGTFTLRYALPDGKQVIPVKAVSADNLEERLITPTVSRETKASSLLREFK